MKTAFVLSKQIRSAAIIGTNKKAVTADWPRSSVLTSFENRISAWEGPGSLADSTFSLRFFWLIPDPRIEREIEKRED